MKILIVVPTAHGGGAEFVAMTWARTLMERGHELGVFTTARAARPRDVPSEISWYGVAEGSGHWKIQIRLRGVIADQKPDVVLALQQYPNLHAILAKVGRSKQTVVISERNLVSIGKSRQGLNHRMKVRVAKLLYRYADRTVAISHAVAADLVGSFDVSPARCIVVPNPALAKVEAIQDSGLATLVRNEIDGGGSAETVLVLACRLVKQKRPTLAVDAAAELVRRGAVVRLILFGGGPLHEHVVERALKAGVIVDDRGWAENWFADVPAGAVHVLPSDQEGLANTLVEAAGAGLRSVAYSRALGVSDALIPGITGTLVREEGAEALADAIETQRGKRVEGVDTWLEQFSAKRSADVLERVLLEVAMPRGNKSRAKATALQIGGAGDIAGGLSQVIRSLSDEEVPGFRVKAMPTRSLESSSATVGLAMSAVVKILRFWPSRRKTVLVGHLSQGGSFVREGGILRIGAALGYPTVVHVHGSSFGAYARSNPRLVRTVLRRASRILVLSDESARAVSTLLPEATVVRLPNSVNVPERLPPKENVVVFGGVVGHRKGVDLLLEAWRTINTEGWDLWLCGPADPAMNLKDIPAGVKLAGAISHDDLLSRLASSSIAVLPSRAEAMPLFVLEAMAAGNAVIASDVGALAEAVDASVGRLVAPGDPGVVAEALADLIADENRRTQMGVNARARATERYSTIRCFPEIANVWTDALASTSGASRNRDKL